MNNENLYAFLQGILSNTSYSSEYDGRMYTYCPHCHRNIDDDENNHDDDCAIIVAQQLIDELCPELELKRIEAIKLREYQDQVNRDIIAQLRYRDCVNCMYCRLLISKSDISMHIGSKRCVKEQHQLIDNGWLSAPVFKKPKVELQIKPLVEIGILAAPRIGRELTYQLNKTKTAIGSQLQCPWCDVTFTKKSYQQVFCCTDHKDLFWNNKRWPSK